MAKPGLFLKFIFISLKRIALIAILAAISFLILEQSFRFYCFGFKSFSVTMMNSVHGIGVSGLVQASPYPEIIYELKPDVNAYFQLKKITTNSQGLRDKEYAIIKPPNTFRVAVIGDSFTMPEGVAIEDAFHTLLEDRYNHEFNATRYEFINFGVAGYDPRQYLAALKHRALAYQPDLVLVCLCGYLDNDFYPEKGFHQPYVPFPEEHSFFKSLVLQFLKNRWTKKNKAGGGGKLDDRTKADKMAPITAALGDISRDQNIPICIVVLRSYPYPNNGTDMDIRRLTKRDGLYYLDTSPAFNGRKPSDYHIYPTNKHPNAKANKIFAETIYQYLQEQHLMEKRLPERTQINAADSFLK